MFPRPLTTYPDASSLPLLDALAERIQIEPFNAIATSIFLLAIVHTFAAASFTRWAHAVERAAERRAARRGRAPKRSQTARLLHFLGEVEVVFAVSTACVF